MAEPFPNRHHLREREVPLSSDVADAISRITGLDGTSLPIAIPKAAIVNMLIDIAHEGAEGQPPVTPLPSAKKALVDLWGNRLTNTAVFRSGYSHYEDRKDYGNFPVCPVTDYFFRVVYGGGDLSPVLEDMSEYEITLSLPKRPSRAEKRVTVQGPNGPEERLEYERDDNGGIATFGEIAGIVVFPRDNHSALLHHWLDRLNRVAIGQTRRAISSLANARPDSPAIDRLKTIGNDLKRDLNRALPRMPK